MDCNALPVSLLLGLLFAGLSVGAANELDDAELIGMTDRRAIDYACGEKMTFTLVLRGAKACPRGTYFVDWRRTGDDGKAEKGRLPLEDLPFSYSTSIDRPGFVRLTASVVDAKGKAYRKELHVDGSTPEGKAALNRWERADKRVFFDGSAGAEPTKIGTVPEPEDFDAFWARRRARLAKVPLEAEKKEIKSWRKDSRMFAVSIKCAGPRPSTGYLTVPSVPGKYPISVSFHGYGHTYPNKGHVVAPIGGNGKTIHFNFSPHGYELEREPEYYDEFYRSICSGGCTFGFDPKQNTDPETCYFSGYTYRVMRALEWLKTLPEWDGRNLVVSGGSMGGMQSLWAAGLDPDVTEARPSIPWNCDIGGRDTLGRTIDPWYIHETPALRYYDNVFLAKRISRNCKVEITRAGLGDYCCPPSGIWAMWNNLPCAKKCTWVQGSTHGHVPKDPTNQSFVIEEPVR